MKMRRYIALCLTATMFLGLLTSCEKKVTDTTETAETSVTTKTTKPTDIVDPDPTTPSIVVDDKISLTGFTDLGAQEAVNEGTDPIVIWSWNHDLEELIDIYTDISFEYEVVGDGDIESYKAYLDKAFDSGEDLPDLYVADSSWAQEYIDSDRALPINELGLDYADLQDMFAYILYSSDDSERVIRGITWEAAPAGVFYNKLLTEEYLGVTEPSEVSQYFSSWDSFLKMAQAVQKASEGEAKAIATIGDLETPYGAVKKTPWIVNGTLTVDPDLEGFYTYADAFFEENLTFEVINEEGGITVKPYTNENILSYWGTLDMGRSLLSDPDDETYGNWGFIKSPVNYCSGGSWLMASPSCDMKKDAGDIMQAICIDPDNLKDMATNKGIFVNSKSIMKEMSEDSSFGLEWLGGQNPYTLLFDVASGIDYTITGANDYRINEAFYASVKSYYLGDYDTVDDAKASFEAEVTELA